MNEIKVRFELLILAHAVLRKLAHEHIAGLPVAMREDIVRAWARLDHDLMGTSVVVEVDRTAESRGGRKTPWDAAYQDARRLFPRWGREMCAKWADARLACPPVLKVSFSADHKHYRFPRTFKEIYHRGI